MCPSKGTENNDCSLFSDHLLTPYWGKEPVLCDVIGIQAPTHLRRCLCSRTGVQRDGSPGGSGSDLWGGVGLSSTVCDALFRIGGVFCSEYRAFTKPGRPLSFLNVSEG